MQTTHVLLIYYTSVSQTVVRDHKWSSGSALVVLLD